MQPGAVMRASSEAVSSRLVWVDKEKGEFEQAFETSVVIMKRKHA